MCFVISKPYKKLSVIALLFGAVGFFFLSSTFLSKSNENDEATKRETRVINKKSDIARQEPLLRNRRTINATFCHFETNCKTIKCCCIPEQLDPGEVTRTFIENIFKDRCGSKLDVNLILEKSRFPGNKLQKMWLKTDIAIDELILDNCFLTALSSRAFSSMIYNRTTKLHLLNNNISILKRATFRHLPNLRNLVIERNLIRQVEKNLLKDVAGTLECLQFEDAIQDVQVLRNITGSDNLPAVQVLSLRYNHVRIIDTRLFSGVPNVASLYLCGSRVKTIYTDAFESISRSLKQLVLSDNVIGTLPKGLFDSIIRQNADFGLTIDNNPWHCNCSLKWMQEMIKYHPSVMKKSLTCISPERNAGKYFMSANFCDDDDDDTLLSTHLDTTTSNGNITASKTTDMTSSISGTLPATEPAIIRVNCIPRNRRLLRSNHSRHVSANATEMPFLHFTAERFDNGSVLVILPDENDLSLIWFANDARSDPINLENSTRCVSHVSGFCLLRDLKPRTSYTICLRDNLGFSPLNCLGLTTFAESGTWLNGVDKSVIITVFVASLMLVCFMSAILMFVTVRLHPTMLRGSKRVVIVKRREAMVLPKGLSSDTINAANDNAISTTSRNLKENGYVTPLPLARNLTRERSRSSRRSSEQSDGTSYISGIESTWSHMNSWRLKRELSYVNRETEPPPLPPHPRHLVQASSTVEDLNENATGHPTFAV